MRIKKGDNVRVLAGKDRGKRGKILSVDPDSGKAIVEGINRQKKSVRPKKQGEKGQIVEYNAPLPASRLMVVCPKCGKPARLGSGKGDQSLRRCLRCQAEFK